MSETQCHKIVCSIKMFSLESAVVMEQLIQEKFYEVLFPHLSQFELGSGFHHVPEKTKVEKKVTTTKETPSQELGITESVRVLALDEEPSMPTSIDVEFPRLVFAGMLAMTIIYTMRFLIVRRMGCFKPPA